MSKRFAIMMGLGFARLARALAKVMKVKLLLAAKAPAFRSEASAPDEGMPAVFQPEVLLPIQYTEALRRKHLLTGEKLLMFAVLEDAVEGFMKNLNAATAKGRARFREAEEWINSEDKVWLFSFDNVCESLDIDPEYMRGGLHRWKQAQLEQTKGATAA